MTFLADVIDNGWRWLVAATIPTDSAAATRTGGRPDYHPLAQARDWQVAQAQDQFAAAVAPAAPAQPSSSAAAAGAPITSAPTGPTPRMSVEARNEAPAVEAANLPTSLPAGAVNEQGCWYTADRTHTPHLCKQQDGWHCEWCGTPTNPDNNKE